MTVVFNNGLLGASRADQMNRYGGRAIGTELHNPDFARLAEVYGAVGIRIEDHRELGAALEEGLKAERPAVIEVPIPNLRPPFQTPPHGLDAVVG